MVDWQALQVRITGCEACPRLRRHCQEIARVRRASYRDWEYWGKPVPNFGEPQSRLLIVGLAPAAHGANRTGRMFTGDRSGSFLFEAMHAQGFCNLPDGVSADDGLALQDCLITAAVHCAPPDNKPTREEQETCSGFLVDTLRAMPHLQGVVCLGQLGYRALLEVMPALGWSVPRPRPTFTHGAEIDFAQPAGGPWIITTYHPSQQNTFTGRLTQEMLQAIFARARERLKGRG